MNRLNRFSYVYNNPLKYVDPTGHYNVEHDRDWDNDWAKEYARNPTGQWPSPTDSMEARAGHSLLASWQRSGRLLERSRLGRPLLPPSGYQAEYQCAGRVFRRRGRARAAISITSAKLIRLNGIQFNIPEGVDLAENIRATEVANFSRMS